MGVFQFSTFSALPELVHGISTSNWGNLSNRWAAANKQTNPEVRAARQRFFKALGAQDNQVVSASLVHGSDIYIVKPGDQARGADDPSRSIVADILVTDTPDTFLFFVIADCMGLFFYDPKQQVCALAHAGWRGVEQRVPEKTVRYLVQTCRCRVDDLVVGISPAIRASSLRFPTAETIQHQLPGWEPYLRQVGDLTEINSVGYARDQLLSTGIKPGQIEDCGIDTRTNPEFFSHRRSQEESLPEARFGCLIGIRKTAKIP